MADEQRVRIGQEWVLMELAGLRTSGWFDQGLDGMYAREVYTSLLFMGLAQGSDLVRGTDEALADQLHVGRSTVQKGLRILRADRYVGTRFKGRYLLMRAIQSMNKPDLTTKSGHPNARNTSVSSVQGDETPVIQAFGGSDGGETPVSQAFGDREVVTVTSKPQNLGDSHSANARNTSDGLLKARNTSVLKSSNGGAYIERAGDLPTSTKRSGEEGQDLPGLCDRIEALAKAAAMKGDNTSSKVALQPEFYWDRWKRNVQGKGVPEDAVAQVIGDALDDVEAKWGEPVGKYKRPAMWLSTVERFIATSAEQWLKRWGVMNKPDLTSKSGHPGGANVRGVASSPSASRNDLNQTKPQTAAQKLAREMEAKVQGERDRIARGEVVDG